MATVQNHIHLSTAIGSAPENAPTYTWRARDRGKVPVYTGRVARSLQGYLYTHVITRSGSPVVSFDYRYELVLRPLGGDTTIQLEDRLNGFAGKELYLVDHRHCDDGADHTSYIKHVYVAQIGEYQVDVLNLGFYFVQIMLNGLDT